MQGYYAKIEVSGVGSIWIAKTRRGICSVSFCYGKSVFLRSLPRHTIWIEDDQIFAGIKEKIGGLIKGETPPAGVALDLSGTKFQEAVWKNIAKIPRGETRSYAWLARAAGRPKGYRAVANACGANPVPIVIPCHRVIASDGSIGGFSSGINLKKKLLLMEGVKLTGA